MNYIDLTSIEDIQNFYTNNHTAKINPKNIKNYIFREFEKKDDVFIATDKFFISNEIDDEMLEFNSFNINNSYKSMNNDICERIIPDSNNKDIYILINPIYNKYVDLILVSNISFSFNDTNVCIKDIINKTLSNDTEFNEKIFEDLYYNEDFSNKINLNVPHKYKEKIDDTDVIKKYLFKVELNNIDSLIYQQQSKHLIYN